MEIERLINGSSSDGCSSCYALWQHWYGKNGYYCLPRYCMVSYRYQYRGPRIFNLNTELVSTGTNGSVLQESKDPLSLRTTISPCLLIWLKRFRSNILVVDDLKNLCWDCCNQIQDPINNLRPTLSIVFTVELFTATLLVRGLTISHGRERG